MKRYLYSVPVILALLAALLLPITKPGEYGAMNTITGWYTCREHWACVHEIGHVLDRRAGWVSQSQEFSDALILYVMTAPIEDELPLYILAHTYGAKDGEASARREVYAYLYRYSDGDPLRLPPGLRPFFDWEYGERLLEDVHE